MSDQFAYDVVWHGGSHRDIRPDEEILAARQRVLESRSLKVETHRIDAAVDGEWRTLPAICDRAQLSIEVVRGALRHRVEYGTVERIRQVHPGVKGGTWWLYRRVA